MAIFVSKVNINLLSTKKVVDFEKLKFKHNMASNGYLMRIKFWGVRLREHNFAG